MSNNTVKAQSNFVSSDAIDVKNVTYITAKGNPARNPIFIHTSRAKVGGAVSTVNNKFYKGGQVMPKEIVQEIDLNKISYAVL